MLANPTWVLVQPPAGRYVPSVSFELRDFGPPPPLEQGFVRAKAVAMTTAPGLRGALSKLPPGRAPTIEQVVRVTESRSDKFPVGMHVHGYFPTQRVVTFHANQKLMKPVQVSAEVPVEKFLSIMSTNAGITAWYATEYVETGRVEAPCNKTVVVTSAASATGMIAGQLYKLKGCKVIGVTSTPAKAERLMGLGGFDAVIPYRAQDLHTRLGQLAPEGIDIDFENVGGPQLEAIVHRMKMHGRVVLCGAIHEYDKAPADYHGFKWLVLLIAKRIRMEGIHVNDIYSMNKWGDIAARMMPLIREGKLRSVETIVHGFSKWPDAMRMILDSKNIGRLVVLADDDAARAEL